MNNDVVRDTKVNLLNFDLEGLSNYFKSLSEPAFRAQQLFQWIHQRGVTDFDQMTNLSKSLRVTLKDVAVIQPLEIAYTKVASDGTSKWVCRLDDGNCIETVFIPEDDRGTLCVSSQVGCGLNCSFCSTAQQGFNRNLTVAEIIGQVWIAVRALSEENGMHDKAVTNVVMMGMGEPLLNFDPVVKAMSIMRHDLAYGLSKYRVTLSTSGVVPAMEKLKTVSDVALAVSLHAPVDDVRNILVPLNKKYPIKTLLNVCRDYFEHEPRRKVTFEYVMLSGINDSDQHAKGLANILKSVPCKINLIPFNSFPGALYTCSSKERMQSFQSILKSFGLIATIRKTRGDDIDAACGQLVGEFKDRTVRSKRRLIPLRVERAALSS